MPNLAVHLIKKYYEKYKTREIAFNKSVINFTGLEPRKVFLKIKGEQWSCVVYSCSMQSAKVITNMDTQSFEILKKAKNFINLRLSFSPQDSKSPIVFFIPSHIDGYKNFNSSNKSTYILNLGFTQKPPDDLIEILGNILQEKENFEKRKEIRITLDGKIISDIGLQSNKAVIEIENIKRPCILKNVSASGIFLFLSCNPKFILNKDAKLFLPLGKPNKILPVEGIILRSEEVTGRKDIYGIALSFNQDKISLEFKQLINNYLDKLEEMVKHK